MAEMKTKITGNDYVRKQDKQQERVAVSFKVNNRK
jgi:hypothetical protein